MKIFTSHSSKDKVIIDIFIEKILILGCGIDDKDIFCTSIEGLGIKTGEDFREHIKSKLSSADYSILLVSNNYKSSEICLSEMGASWALPNLKVIPFVFPDLDYHSIGTLYSVKQVAKLDDSSVLDELYEELSSKYRTEKKITRWNKCKNDFLTSLDQFQKDKGDLIKPNPEEYFKQYVKENASLNHLLLKAHPTLLDCKEIFHRDHYRDFFKYYCENYDGLTSEVIEPNYPKRKFFRITKSDTNELQKGINNIAGGMVDSFNKGVFNYNVDFYKVSFLEKQNSEAGISYKVFCYVNERWVFISAPWRFR